MTEYLIYFNQQWVGDHDEEWYQGRVAPSRAKGVAKTKKMAGAPRTKMPLIVVANSTKKDAALAGLARWKARHPDAASHLHPADVLVDAMRGRFRTWTRVRVNLQHVPEALRPPQEPLDPGEDMAAEWHGRAPAGS